MKHYGKPRRLFAAILAASLLLGNGQLLTAGAAQAPESPAGQAASRETSSQENLWELLREKATQPELERLNDYAPTDVFKEFDHRETNHMDQIFYAMEERADDDVGHILEDLQILNGEGPILVFLLAVGRFQTGQILENVSLELDAVQAGNRCRGAELHLFIADCDRFLQHRLTLRFVRDIHGLVPAIIGGFVRGIAGAALDQPIVAACAVDFRRKAQEAYDAYQSTGMKRYDNAYHKYEALADALDRDVQKADLRQAAASLKSELIMLASAASRAKLFSAPEGALLALAKEVIAVGRLYGYDGKEMDA